MLNDFGSIGVDFMNSKSLLVIFFFDKGHNEMIDILNNATVVGMERKVYRWCMYSTSWVHSLSMLNEVSHGSNLP